ncbi:hypothetical protein JKJ07_21550 [Actinoplanes sp. LDG1-01]|uniref:Uncharacterized protein n=1 Tax=Paractinoplanes lichenicola TaxID=2802976 RepID=A0ABS1VRW9_9ACTN|nr:hypothetical protein [Actinoplanes lichenicola]
MDRLLNQIRVWEQPRWNQDDRAIRTYALVQRLADLGADAEGRPRREVPREHDMILPDQVRVLADDLLATGSEPALAEAATAVDDLRAYINT